MALVVVVVGKANKNAPKVVENFTHKKTRVEHKLYLFVSCDKIPSKKQNQYKALHIQYKSVLDGYHQQDQILRETNSQANSS